PVPRPAVPTGTGPASAGPRTARAAGAGDERLQLTAEFPVALARQVRIDPSLDRSQSQLLDRLHDPVERESGLLGGLLEARCRRSPEEEDRHAVSREQDTSKTAYWFSGLALIPGSSDEGKRVPHLFLGDPGPVALDDEGGHCFAPAGVRI